MLRTGEIQHIGKLKNEYSRRTIPIWDDEFLDVLLSRRGADDQFLFVGKESGKPLFQPTFNLMWARLMKAMVERATDIAGKYKTKTLMVIEDGKKVKKESTVKSQSILTPHYFRHNFATFLYWAGVTELQAANWMGHADTTMISKIYAHIRATDTAAEVKKVFDYLRMNTMISTSCSVMFQNSPNCWSGSNTTCNGKPRSRITPGFSGGESGI